MIEATRIESGSAPPELMASVQSLRDSIQRTTGGAVRGTATLRPATAAQVTVDLDALFGAAPPPPVEPAAKRTGRAIAPPARAPAKSRSHIAIAGLLIGMAGLIALYVQLYSLNTERQSGSPRLNSISPSPQAILPAPAAPPSEPLAAPASGPIKTPVEENPALRSLLAADRQATRPPRAVVETVVATVAAPLPTALEPTIRQDAVPLEPAAPPPVASGLPPAVPSAIPDVASTPVPAAVAPPVLQAPTAPANATPPTIRSVALVPVSRPQPAFPQQALRDRVAGRVVARVTVGIDGAVSAVEIESSTPPRVFDRAAVTALRQWRYVPIDRPQQTTIELDFKLE